MGKRLYVGNLPYSVNEQDLTEKFGAFGTVETATLITDRDTGRSKGFGFVEMSTPEEASAAIEAINGSEHDGRTLKVDAAQERAPSRDNY